MEQKKTIKITCLSCDKTGNYKVKPNYCAYCGNKISDNKYKQNE